MSSIRRVVKSALEVTLVTSGAAGLVRRLRGLDSVILAYHNIVPDGVVPSGDQSLHLPLELFRRQLDRLTRTHQVVSLPALFSPNSGGAPRAAITFDDAYLGAVTLGVEEAVRRGLPVTVFVAPGILGGRSVWWDELADPMSGEVPDERRQYCLEKLGGEETRVLTWARDQGLPLREAPAHLRTALEGQVAQIAALAGVTLGSHTWSHPNLTRLPAEALRRELEEPWAWLRKRFPSAIPWIAYPYGLADLRVAAAAAAAGYAGGLLVAGGASRSHAVPAYDLPRLNVASGLSPRGLLLRTSGL